MRRTVDCSICDVPMIECSGNFVCPHCDVPHGNHCQICHDKVLKYVGVGPQTEEKRRG